MLSVAGKKGERGGKENGNPNQTMDPPEVSVVGFENGKDEGKKGHSDTVNDTRRRNCNP